MKLELTKILNSMGAIVYRRNMRFFCKGCDEIIGNLYMDLKDPRNKWAPYWCKCENYRLLTSLDIDDIVKIKKDILYANNSGRFNPRERQS